MDAPVPSGIPLVIETRDGHPQAIHHGHAVLIRGDGTVESWGDPGAATWWRSAPKALQAVPFVRSGAMDAFRLGAEDLALACASHNSEPGHVERAAAMLDAAGLDEPALVCGAHRPLDPEVGRTPEGGWTPLQNNCSGKHAAMLATCVREGWDPARYAEPDGPLQLAILDVIAQATGRPAGDIERGTDGCSVPTFWLPIADLANAYRWLERDDAGRRCLDAMVTHPWLVAGTGRFCTTFMQAGGGDLVGKVGAMGVYVALHRPSGDALAVKLTGGNGLATETLVATLADRAGWLDDHARDALAPYIDRPVETWHKKRLGSFDVRATWR